MAHDAFQMAHAAAAAVAFARIEGDNHMAALPNSGRRRIDAEADAVAERPDADEAVQMPMRRSQTGRENIGVVVDKNRRGDTAGAAPRYQGLMCGP